jgi:O-antigen/teichoic acid export membrane protein
MKNKFISANKTQNLSSLESSLFIKEFLLFGLSSILYQGSRFVVNLGVAKILGPSTYGLWNMLNLILLYGSVIHLGVINAMNRDVPLFNLSLTLPN